MSKVVYWLLWAFVMFVTIVGIHASTSLPQQCELALFGIETILVLGLWAKETFNE